MQSTTIPGDSVVLVVTAQLRNEFPILIGDLAVPVTPEPLRHLSDRSCQSALRRLLPDHPCPAAMTSPPVMSEPKQIERSRSAIAALTARRAGRFCKAYKTSLLWMQRQTVSAKSLWQYNHQLLRVTLHRAHDHEVVGIADQKRFSSKLRLRHVVEPRVENVMQIDVRQKGRDHS